MTIWTILAVILAIVLIARIIYSSIRRQTTPDLVTGGLYSFNAENGRFGVAKILVLESGVVHITVYKNKFNERPTQIDTSILSVGTMLEKEFGIVHVPITRKDFLGWGPELILQQTVTKEELVGYEYWKEEQGGVFGKP
jgi:hypothetical protein